MGDPEDDERTRRARERKGRRGNGKATLSPVKQREKASKAYVHVFKHNIKALKLLQKEREMLDAMVEERELGETSHSTCQNGPSVERTIDGMDDDTSHGAETGTESPVALDACPGDPPADAMAIDPPEHARADVCPEGGGDNNDPTVRRDMEVPPGWTTSEGCWEQWDIGSSVADCSPIPEDEATTGRLQVELNVRDSRKGQLPTDRNIADNKHWTALLPTLRAPFLDYIARRYQATTSTFVDSVRLESNCTTSCTRNTAEVDCLFLECRYSHHGRHRPLTGSEAIN
jgi:hypothetical protein